MVAYPTNPLARQIPAAEAVAFPSTSPRWVAAGSTILTQADRLSVRQLKGVFSEMYTEALGDMQSGTSYIVGVTSAIRGEGRTTTALGISLAMARDLDLHVLLLELDLEQPSLARELGVQERPGLVDVLSGEAQLSQALHQLPSAIDLLPAGTEPQATSRLLRSAALRQLLDTARAAYDVTVLDLPPALSSSDVVPLSGLTDAILVAVRAGVTPARLVDQAVARFESGKVRGLVLNGQHSKIPSWLRRRL